MSGNDTALDTTENRDQECVTVENWTHMLHGGSPYLAHPRKTGFKNQMRLSKKPISPPPEVWVNFSYLLSGNIHNVTPLMGDILQKMRMKEIHPLVHFGWHFHKGLIFMANAQSHDVFMMHLHVIYITIRSINVL